MGKISTAGALTLEYNPYTKAGDATEGVLSKVPLKKPEFETDDAASIRLSLEDNRATDADTATKAVDTTTIQNDGIVALTEIVTSQQEIVSALASGTKGGAQASALQAEFNALVTEYNRVYSALFENLPESQLRLSEGGRIDADADLENRITYNAVEVSSSTLTLSGGLGTSIALADIVNSTDTAIDPGIGVNDSFTVDLGSLASGTTVDSTAYDPLTDIIALPLHGYNDGDRVQFSGADLPGGISAGQNYYVLANDENSILLYTDAALTNLVDITSTGSGNSDITRVYSDLTYTNDTLYLAGHGLTTGTRVRFTNSDTLPAEFQENTDYYVIVDDADTLRFAASRSDALSNIAIDISEAGFGNADITSYLDNSFDAASDEVSFTAHGLNAGERIQFTGAGTAPTGLSKNTDYYVIDTGDPDVFKVAASYADAIAEIAIDFSDNGSGSLDLRTFETESAFDSTTDAITYAGHGYATGQRIQFSGASGTSLPDGLSTGTDYYVIALDANTFQVATSQADAIALNEVNFTGSSSGTFNSIALGASDFNSTTDTLTIAGHGLTTGQQVRLDGGESGSALPTGITYESYYVIVQDANTIKLAASESDAIGGTAIDFTGLGSQQINVTAYTETTTASDGQQGEYDLESALGLLSAQATLESISSRLSGLLAESNALNARLKGIAAYKQTSS